MQYSLNWKILIFVILLFLVLPTIVAADQNTVLSLDEVLQHVQTRQETLSTFSADFKQVQKNALFIAPQTSAGRLYFDRVGILLMKMHQPEPFVVLLTQGKMISGTPGSPLRQKNIPGGNTFLQKMLGIGRSAEQLKKQFHIRMNPSPDGDLYALELRPVKITRRMPYLKIKAEIDSQIWLPLSLQLVEPGGDSVGFTFRYTRINTPLPENIFDIGPIEPHSTPSDDTHESK